MKLPANIPLGKTTSFGSDYEPGLLCSIPRQVSRQELGINNEKLPFFGYDKWTAWELSWLDGQGKPQVAIAEFEFPANTGNIIESKSLKLYLNSLNQKRFNSWADLQKLLKKDLSACCAAPVDVFIFEVTHYQVQSNITATCIDHLDISCNTYTCDSSLLEQGDKSCEIQLCSHIFRSLCPVTSQPDWASIFVSYKGKEIKQASMLKYLVSFRQHQGFHEQCVERIFCDLWALDNIESLDVYARFLRRGGLDINPYRSSSQQRSFAGREARQ